MILAELHPDGRCALGPFGPGLLVLSPDPLGAADPDRFMTHRLEYAAPDLSARLLIARGAARVCRATGLWFVPFNLGAVPVVLESSPADTVLVRVGYRKAVSP